ncbi:hypothetical protein H2200_013517 [Cladophialophora chaetospira]|uniref:BRCT domain-containing protein n=1 Tax=Cladophialophora chaetospira TaxID=386627 RepID=A0AA38U4K3_9EURO|nr:hypothetical protein H2200_013517 [Cladophialophora chaetospira]
MPKRFGNIILASTGDFPKDTDNKIKGWVEHAGGTFARELSKDVTHLLCSEKAWKRYYPIVKEARRIKSVHIVKLNWLEQSLWSKTGKPLDTAPYLWEQRKVTKCGIRKRKRADLDSPDGEDDVKDKPSKRQKKPKKADAQAKGQTKDRRIAKAGKEFDEACAEFQQYMGKRNYRPFTDKSGFVYLLTLVRKDVLKNRLEKHRVKVRYAPSFTSQHDIFIPITNQAVDPRRKESDVSLSLSGRIEYQSSDTADCDDLPPESPSLPPCPVPLYYFPKPYPYSHNPCVASSLPRQLTSSNPKLRVRIRDPWAQSVQIFVSDESPRAIPNGKPRYSMSNQIPPLNLQELRTRSYAVYTVYSKPGICHYETIAPLGSTFDFAWAAFNKFIKPRIGVEWGELHRGWQRGFKVEDLLKERVGGVDGATDRRRWDVVEPTTIFKHPDGAVGDSLEPAEARATRPTVTMVVNTPKVKAGDQIDARAMTPEDGW